MNIFQIELTKQEAKIDDEVMARIDKTVAYLASLSHTERINWLKEHQYSRPISFERKIGGTVYSVNAHFNGDAAEAVEQKVKRILNRNIAH